MHSLLKCEVWVVYWYGGWVSALYPDSIVY